MSLLRRCRFYFRLFLRFDFFRLFRWYCCTASDLLFQQPLFFQSFIFEGFYPPLFKLKLLLVWFLSFICFGITTSLSSVFTPLRSIDSELFFWGVIIHMPVELLNEKSFCNGPIDLLKTVVMTFYLESSWNVRQNYTIIALICLLSTRSKAFGELFVAFFCRKIKLQSGFPTF